MRRLAAVVVVSLAGFAAAFVALGDASRQTCAGDAAPAPGYEVEVEDPVAAGGGELVVAVHRNSRPVRDAWLCVRLAPEGAPAAGVAGRGRHSGRGRYAVTVDLGRPGVWEGVVLVEEPGRAAPVSLPARVVVR